MSKYADEKLDAIVNWWSEFMERIKEEEVIITPAKAGESLQNIMEKLKNSD